MRVTDFVGTNVEFGRLGLSSLRTRSCRWTFATCARGSRVNGMGSVFLVLRQTCNTACMWAWANLQNRPHKRLSGLRKPWRHCRVLRDLLATSMTTSASPRRGCSWERVSRTPWTTTSGWSHRWMMAPLQRRLEGGLRRTLTVPPGSEVSELARERAKLTTCFGGLGIRVAQLTCTAGLRQNLVEDSMFWNRATLQNQHGAWIGCARCALRLHYIPRHTARMTSESTPSSASVQKALKRMSLLRDNDFTAKAVRDMIAEVEGRKPPKKKSTPQTTIVYNTVYNSRAASSATISSGTPVRREISTPPSPQFFPITRRWRLLVVSILQKVRMRVRRENAQMMDEDL